MSGIRTSLDVSPLHASKQHTAARFACLTKSRCSDMADDSLPPKDIGSAVPEGFVLPWNTMWTMADAWGLTPRQCQNIAAGTERPAPKRTRKPPKARWSTIWNAASVEKLRKLWAGTDSCSRIARKLGPAFTKSAVISKVRRLDLPPRRNQGSIAA